MLYLTDLRAFLCSDDEASGSSWSYLTADTRDRRTPPTTCLILVLTASKSNYREGSINRLGSEAGSPLSENSLARCKWWPGAVSCC